MKAGRLPVNIEASGGQHPEDLHHVLNGRITLYDPFHHHQFILLEWFMDPKLIHS